MPTLSDFLPEEKSTGPSLSDFLPSGTDPVPAPPPATETPKTKPFTANLYMPIVSSAAREHGVPEDLMFALTDQESTWDPTSRSSKGAIGLTQVMPETAKSLGVDVDALIRDPHLQAKTGSRYLRRIYDEIKQKYPGQTDEQNWTQALAWYNGGPDQADALRSGRPLLKETADYIDQVTHKRIGYRRTGTTAGSSPATTGHGLASVAAVVPSASGSPISGVTPTAVPTVTPPSTPQGPTPIEQDEARRKAILRDVQQRYIVRPDGVYDKITGRRDPRTIEQIANDIASGGFLQSATRGFEHGLLGGVVTTPELRKPKTGQSWAASKVEDITDIVGQILPLSAATKAAGLALKAAGLGKTLTPMVMRILENGGSGAMFGIADAIINERDKIVQMPTSEAVKYVLTKAGIQGASWAVLGAATEGLIRAVKAGSPVVMRYLASLRGDAARVSPKAPAAPEMKPSVPPAPVFDVTGRASAGQRFLAEWEAGKIGYPGERTDLDKQNVRRLIERWMEGEDSPQIRKALSALGLPAPEKYLELNPRAGGPAGTRTAPLPPGRPKMEEIAPGVSRAQATHDQMIQAATQRSRGVVGTFAESIRVQSPSNILGLSIDERMGVPGRTEVVMPHEVARGKVQATAAGVRDVSLGENKLDVYHSDIHWSSASRDIHEIYRRILGYPEHVATPEVISENLEIAMTLYREHLQNPQSFAAKIEAAIRKSPRLSVPYDLMKRMISDPKYTPAREYVEKVILGHDMERNAFLDRTRLRSAAETWDGQHYWGGTQFQHYTGLLDGILAGADPVSLRITDVQRIADTSTARAILDRNIQRTLQESGLAHFGGNRPPDAFGDWVRFDIRGESVWALRGSERIVKQLMDIRPFSEYQKGPLSVIQRIQDFYKIARLSWSAYHDFNLIRVFAANHPVEFVRGIGRGDLPGFYAQGLSAVAQGLRAYQEGGPAAEALLKAGMKVGRSMDSTIDSYLDTIKIRPGTPLRDGIKRVLSSTFASKVRQIMPMGQKSARQIALWDQLHAGLKFHDAMITLERDVMPKFRGTINPRTGQEWTLREMADHVRSAMDERYGGIAWDRTGFTRGVINAMRQIFFAPDWELAQIRQMSSAVRGGFSPGAFRTWFTNSPHAYLARKNLMNQALAWQATNQVISMALNGHPTWQNPDKGHELDLQLPFKDHDGKNLYINPMKGAAMHYLTNAAGKVIDASREPNYSQKAAILLSFFGQKFNTLMKAATQAIQIGTTPVWRSKQPGGLEDFLSGDSTPAGKKPFDRWAPLRQTLTPMPINLQGGLGSMKDLQNYLAGQGNVTTGDVVSGELKVLGADSPAHGPAKEMVPYQPHRVQSDFADWLRTFLYGPKRKKEGSAPGLDEFLPPER